MGIDENKNKSYLIFIMFILIGVAFSLVAKSYDGLLIPSQQNLLNPTTAYNGELKLENLKMNNAIISQQLEFKKNRLDFYNQISSDNNNKSELALVIGEQLEKELDDIRVVNGSVPVEGKGIVITLEDSDKKLEAGEDPNKYIVHNSDILVLINELRDAGAEAISLNNFRIDQSSYIDCGGAVINVNGQISSPPFVIEAIGDPDALNFYLNSEESIIPMLKNWEIKVKIVKSEYIYLNKVSNK